MAEEEEWSDSSSSSGDEDVEILQQKPRPDAVYNVVALHDKLEEIAWPEDGTSWLQTLTLTITPQSEIDASDDLAREMAFYTQALEGSREAFSRLESMGLPFLRPTDYYAEMVKSDGHMLRVKDVLLSSQKRMQEAEERRKAREAKRFSKEVQAEKLKERAKSKKQDIESVKKWRKMRKDSDFAKGGGDGGMDFPAELGGGDESPPPTKKRKPGNNSAAPWDRSGGKGGGKAGKKPRSSGFPEAKGEGRGNSEKKPWGRSEATGAGRGSSGKKPWDRSDAGGDGRVGGGKKGDFREGGRGVRLFAKKEGRGANREQRNSKYGFGGKKGMKKKNTSDSSADVRGFKGGFKRKFSKG